MKIEMSKVGRYGVREKENVREGEREKEKGMEGWTNREIESDLNELDDHTQITRETQDLLQFVSLQVQLVHLHLQLCLCFCQLDLLWGDDLGNTVIDVHGLDPLDQTLTGCGRLLHDSGVKSSFVV